MGATLVSVELEGTFPDTLMVVTIQNGPNRSPPQRVHRLPIWDDPQLHRVFEEDMVPSPAQCGGNIAGWAMES
jgi:hypothetical protein